MSESLKVTENTKIYIYRKSVFMKRIWNLYKNTSRLHTYYILNDQWAKKLNIQLFRSFIRSSFLFLIFQLVWQIVLLAGLRSTWAVLGEMHVRARVENKDNLSVVMCDSFIVFGRTRSCFGWLTCLGLIVWSGVCCASLIPALNYMTACSLLTLRVEVMWNVHVTKTHRT